MSTNSSEIFVSGIRIDVTRKAIKNVHLSVCPPEGSVRISAPKSMSDDNARLAVIRRLPWIRRCQEEFQSQRRETERQFVSGESHYFDGRRYLLDVVPSVGATAVVVQNNGRIRLETRPTATRDAKRRAFDNFYRAHLCALVSSVLPDYQERLGVKASDVRIQRMKTRWGSCTQETGRILLNLELAKKPRPCVEYILVHELAHLTERTHSAGFVEIVERAIPDWRQRRDLLNSLPLAYETWGY
jgi:predicted metal-dependent hydrolase